MRQESVVTRGQYIACAGQCVAISLQPVAYGLDVHADLEGTGELLFARTGQQRHTANLAQVGAHVFLGAFSHVLSHWRLVR
jgi:hypothetical protein